MMVRRKPGEIRDAVVAHLQEIGGPARVTEIEQAVVSRLGSQVPSSSVRSYLRLNTPAMFVRTARGTYALQESLALPSGGPPARESFTFGSARLYEGDCLEWIERQPRNSIQGIVTDPPYGLVEYTQSEQAKLREGRGGVWRIPPAYDGHVRSPLPRFTTLSASEIEEIESFFFRWASAFYRRLVPGAHVLVASNPLLSHRVSSALSRAGYEKRGEIIRLVMTMRGGDRPKNAHREFADVSVMPRSMWEPWLLFRKPLEGRVQDNLRAWGTGGLRRISATKPFGDVIKSHPTQPGERSIAPHPSLKPQSFLRQVVRAILPLGRGVVCDPFAGAGSTLAAAEAVGYESVGVEIDPEYVEIARSAIPRLSVLEEK